MQQTPSIDEIITHPDAILGELPEIDISPEQLESVFGNSPLHFLGTAIHNGSDIKPHQEILAYADWLGVPVGLFTDKELGALQKKISAWQVDWTEELTEEAINEKRQFLVNKITSRKPFTNFNDRPNADFNSALIGSQYGNNNLNRVVCYDTEIQPISHLIRVNREINYLRDPANYYGKQLQESFEIFDANIEQEANFIKSRDSMISQSLVDIMLQNFIDDPSKKHRGSIIIPMQHSSVAYLLNRLGLSFDGIEPQSPIYSPDTAEFVESSLGATIDDGVLFDDHEAEQRRDNFLHFGAITLQEIKPDPYRQALLMKRVDLPIEETEKARALLSLELGSAASRLQQERQDIDFNRIIAYISRVISQFELAEIQDLYDPKNYSSPTEKRQLLLNAFEQKRIKFEAEAANDPLAIFI